MKYIREKDGKRIIVEKKKHTRVWMIQAVLKWSVCISVLCLTVLLCIFLDIYFIGTKKTKILHISVRSAHIICFFDK